MPTAQAVTNEFGGVNYDFPVPTSEGALEASRIARPDRRTKIEIPAGFMRRRHRAISLERLIRKHPVGSMGDLADYMVTVLEFRASTLVDAFDVMHSERVRRDLNEVVEIWLWGQRYQWRLGRCYRYELEESDA